MSKKKPNIVFFFTDQHTKTSLPFYGSTITDTPYLSKIADEGVVFENTYTTCPICSPARASLQTGLYPFQHGMQTNIFQHGCMVHELRDCEELLSRRLVKAGYNAGYTGKWHLGYDYEDPFYKENYKPIDRHYGDLEYPERYTQKTAVPSDFGYVGDDFPGHGGGGYDYPQFKNHLKEEGLELKMIPCHNDAEITSGEETAMDYYLADRAIKQIEEFRKSDKPFFFMLNFWGPHGPAYVPTKYFEKYRNMSFDPWPTFDEDQTDKPLIHNMKRNKRPWEWCQEHLRYYYAYVDFIDSQIGRVVEYMKETGLYDDSAIVFSADHGDSMGIHAGLFDKGIYMYDQTTSIPLVVRPPGGLKKGRRSEKMTNTTDIYSTILDLAGVAEQKQRRHGRSVMPLVNGDSPSDWPQYTVTECSGIGHCLFTTRMIRDDRYKYVFNCGDLDELYDLQKDPNETNNLFVDESYADKIREMRKALEAWMLEKGDRLVGQYRLLREF